MLPSIFVSHGAPTLALDAGPTGAAWRALIQRLPKPEAILVISAHWETAAPEVSEADPPKTIHDFGGFPDALYRIQYPAPGAPKLAARVADLLGAAGHKTTVHPTRGLDHGAWVPLREMEPDANIRSAQLSIQTHLGPRHAYAIGQALRPLRDEGVLILASGGIVHNLRQLDWNAGDEVKDSGLGWATTFNDWMAEHTMAGDTEALLDYRRLAPNAVQSHPTEEHLLPFYVALGAGSGTPERVTVGYTYGSLGMDAYLFN
jgi:4,5-DOPA dioxygenase extradiol